MSNKWFVKQFQSGIHFEIGWRMNNYSARLLSFFLFDHNYCQLVTVAAMRYQSSQLEKR